MELSAWLSDVQRLTVLALKCILRTNAKQHNEVISTFTEGSALRTSKQLPGRDTLVLFSLDCLNFLVLLHPHPPNPKALGDVRQRNDCCVGGKRGD